MDEGLEREGERETGSEELREAILGLERDLHPARDEEHEHEQQCGGAAETELLRESGVDEVGVEVRDQLVAVRGRERPLAEAGPAEAAAGNRIERLHELIALAVLPQHERSRLRAEDLCLRPGCEPDRDPLVHMRNLLVRGRAADREEHEPGCHVRQARSRDVEHRGEDPEIQECRTEVVGFDEYEHRPAPDQKQWAEVLQAPLCKHLALVPQVGGEEDDQEDLRQLARLKLELADVNPEALAVDLRPDHREPRQEEQRDRSDPEQVLVRLEQAVVAPQPEEGDGEQHNADDDPEPLLERVRGPEAVDLRQADRSQQAGHR